MSLYAYFLLWFIDKLQSEMLKNATGNQDEVLLALAGLKQVISEWTECITIINCAYMSNYVSLKSKTVLLYLLSIEI